MQRLVFAYAIKSIEARVCSNRKYDKSGLLEGGEKPKKLMLFNLTKLYLFIRLSPHGYL